jgi:hypothetical protein
MTEERPTKLVVDCSLPEGHPDKVQIIPLTDEEIAEREAQAAQAAIEQAEREAAAEALAALKASARAKLVAGQPLTEEEASILLG